LEDHLKVVNLTQTATLAFKMDWTIDQFDLFDFSRLKSTFLGLYLENIVLKDGLLVCFLLSPFSRIGPQLFFNFVIRRKFEGVVQRSSTHIFDCDQHFPWPCFVLG